MSFSVKTVVLTDMDFLMTELAYKLFIFLCMIQQGKRILIFLFLPSKKCLLAFKLICALISLRRDTQFFPINFHKNAFKIQRYRDLNALLLYDDHV